MLCVLHQCLTAAAAAAAASASTSDDFAALSELIPQVVTLLNQLQTLITQQQQQQQQGEAAGGGSTSTGGISGLLPSKSEDAWQLQQQQLWLLLLWQDLLSLPAAVSQLQQQQLTAAAAQLLLLALHGRGEDTGLELAPGSSVSEQGAAAAALVKLAAWPPPAAAAAGGDEDISPAAAAADVGASSSMLALSSCADTLLQLLRGTASNTAAATAAAPGAVTAAAAAGDSGLLRSRAVGLLGLLAGSSAAAAWQVLQWLKQQVVLHVRQAAWVSHNTVLLCLGQVDVGVTLWQQLHECTGAGQQHYLFPAYMPSCLTSTNPYPPPPLSLQAELSTVLPILNHSCLPALPQDLSPPHSAQAAAFCSDLLEAWQQQQQLVVSPLLPGCSSDTSEVSPAADAVLQSCLLLGQLTARCSLDDERSLLLLVCAWIAQAAAGTDAALGMDVDTQLPTTGPVCIVLSVLAGGRPGLLIAPSTMDLVQAMASLAISSSSSWIDSTAAAVAVGGVLNKSLGLQTQLQRQGGEGAAAAAGGSAVQPEELLAVVLPVLTQPLLTLQQQQQQQGSEVAAAAAVRALGWTARGLALQRHDGWQDIMRQWVLPVLMMNDGAGVEAGVQGSPTQQQQQGAAPAAALSALDWAAADFFSVLVSAIGLLQGTAASSSSSSSSSAGSSAGSSSRDVIDAASGGHRLSLHSMIRPLWQQKTFVLALQALQEAAAAAPQQQLQDQQQQQQQQGEGVWLAIASLISAAPGAFSAAGEHHMLLLQSVVHLLRAWDAVLGLEGSGSCLKEGQQGAAVLGGRSGSEGGGQVVVQQARLLQLLRSCLLMLGDALSSGGEGAVEEFGSHVEILLQTLCGCAVLNPARGVPAVPAAAGRQQQLRKRVVQLAAGVREVAVMCLTSCMSLPYHLLHTHRRQVLAAVMVALDDNRRAVRKAAVVCRGSWSSS